MSKVSAKQRVEQLKEWFSWFTNTKGKVTTPRKKVAFEGKKEYIKRKG
jgi:hypothetical protein